MGGDEEIVYGTMNKCIFTVGCSPPSVNTKLRYESQLFKEHIWGPRKHGIRTMNPCGIRDMYVAFLENHSICSKHASMDLDNRVCAYSGVST